jgi:hypothetical protein
LDDGSGREIGKESALRVTRTARQSRESQPGDSSVSARLGWNLARWTVGTKRNSCKRMNRK